MDPKTGAIALFETDEDAERAGYTEKLTPAEQQQVAPMNRRLRRAWSAQRRREKSRKQPDQ